MSRTINWVAACLSFVCIGCVFAIVAFPPLFGQYFSEWPGVAQWLYFKTFFVLPIASIAGVVCGCRLVEVAKRKVWAYLTLASTGAPLIFLIYFLARMVGIIPP
jgi:hypothetical protein